MHNHNFDNDYSLPNSAIFVHVFYNKNMFTNFKKTIKDKKLLYDIDSLAIKGLRKISLSLRIKDQTLILILKKIAYVSNFHFNFVLFACFKDEEYK